MGFLDKIFSKKQKTKIKNSFDAAKTTKDNQRHWSAADGLSADAEASADVRKKLRERSRYEVANNSYAKGLVEMLANDTIGTGTRLQMLTDNENLNRFIESEFKVWADRVNLSAKLRLMRIARCQDGESFALLGNNPKVKGKIKLDLTVIEADRVAGETMMVDDIASADGINFDRFGNVSSYRVLKFHPGSDYFSYQDQAFTVPADYMLHIFKHTRPGLHRGLPELTAALPLFAQLRRYNLAVLSAAEAAADFAAILYTDAPPDGESEDVKPLETIPLERNMMLTIPAGWKMGQLDAKHPTSQHSEFIKTILAEIARCVCATYGTVAGDFSGFNYASGRLDNQIYQKSIIVDRCYWEKVVLDRIFDLWLQEFALVNGIIVRDTSHTWFWDGFLHVDPTKEANAIATQLDSNMTTLAIEYAKKGIDWRTAIMQRAKEISLLKELGIIENVTKKEESDGQSDTDDSSGS